MIKRAGESPTRQEEIIIRMHEDRRLTASQISVILSQDVFSISRVLKYWCLEETPPTTYHLEDPKENMAKSDKNKAERTKNMEKLREGDPIYGLDMDKMRGMYSELDDGECFIVIKQSHQKDKVNLRLGDVSYS